MSEDNDQTRLIRSSRSHHESKDAATSLIMPSSPPVMIDDGERTQMVRRPVVSRTDISSMVSTSNAPGESPDDPVTGWLIVVAGPGKGQYVALGEQDNRVGRGGGDDPPRVSLNFGDAGISRTNAFIIRYDPRKRRFKILPGGGTNIVYLNEASLDAPALINIMDVIEVSETQLLFMPLCSKHFDWTETFKVEGEGD